jgi:Ni/Fe-hydrogenase subunit HybB-like protein
MLRKLPNITFWGVVGALLVVSGIVLTVLRFTQGLGRVTALNDAYPWGLWIGFDVVCGVGLAAGGFTIAALVYLFGFEKYHPIVRPAILTAFLGYIMVVFGLMYDLGRPWSIWHAIIMWNPRSVMFEVAWCVMLYSTVLALEFSPLVMERFKMHRALRYFRYILIPLIILGVILSTLHQSSLGSLFLIVPEKLHPFWYSPLLPVFFYLSAIAVGLAMVIVESYLSFRAFGKTIEMPLLTQLARYMVFVLIFYTALKVADYRNRDVFRLLAEDGPERLFLLLEVVLGVFAPIVMFSIRRIRENYIGLFAGALLAVFGFIMNRINTTITGFESYHGFNYFPSIGEIGISIFIVTLGIIAYRLCVKYLPVFGEEHAGAETTR